MIKDEIKSIAVLLKVCTFPVNFLERAPSHTGSHYIDNLLFVIISIDNELFVSI